MLHVMPCCEIEGAKVTEAQTMESDCRKYSETRQIRIYTREVNRKPPVVS